MTKQKLIEILSKVELLASLPSDTIESIVSNINVVSYSIGEIIAQSNNPADNFSLILKGKARVVEDRNLRNPITLYSLAAGEIFGEDSI